VLWSSNATAARISDVTNTKHNFSATVTPDILGGGDTRDVKANSESEICVFCHTPHGADADLEARGPLWNKTLLNTTYTRYSSSSIDSNIGQVNGVSKLCLSCHDGTIAIGSVRNIRREERTISMSITGGGTTMPAGEGVTTGYTRNLGKDLRNDHPISLTYDSNFVGNDGEMRNLNAEVGDPPKPLFSVRGVGPRPGIQNIHLQPVTPGSSTGQVQCISCHDPHIRETTDNNIKFLRFNRLQTGSPSGAGSPFVANNDIICLACHTKAGWSTSAHAQPDVANETYTNAAANIREFPTGTTVSESACLACHDTHTVQGSRRLLRGGTDGGASGSIKQGGNSAIEETCYACHSSNGDTLSDTSQVPNIKSEFGLRRRMPIDIQNEVHDIVDADLIESTNNLGNRHVECTDCHNPHRVVKRQMFNEHNGNGSDGEGTHVHENNIEHTNIASGVLRGTWGVEPNYSGSESFHTDPTFPQSAIKKGEPTGTSTNVGSDWVTREYQVCLKCHSNYAFGNSPPSLSGGTLTEPGTNGMRNYTNVAREYNSPNNHRGEGQNLGQDGGADGAYDSNNHRSWHPVVNSTGRGSGARGNTPSSNWIQPFQNLGSQTMYCSDCHGSGTGGNDVIPDNGVWGPHGSNNDFILKGPWSNNTGQNTPGDLCFKCHTYQQYAGTGTDNSGFSTNDGCMAMCGMGGGGMTAAAGGAGGGGAGGGGAGGGGDGGGGAGGGGDGGGGGMGGQMNNLHTFHAAQVQNFRCNLCHVAVPHGWKNKNFLVNLNDVGPEAGQNRGTEVRFTTDGYTNGPYYNNAALKIVNFKASGNWVPNDCGSERGIVGVNWMTGGSEACSNVP
jgi:hypothetical protein